MWIGGDTPIELQRNATLTFSGQIWDDVANEPVDLTGSSISCAVANNPGGAVIAEPASAIDDAPQGGFTITLVGSAFDAVAGEQEPVRLAYDVRITSGANVAVVMRGPLILLPGVGE